MGSQTDFITSSSVYHQNPANISLLAAIVRSPGQRRSPALSPPRRGRHDSTSTSAGRSARRTDPPPRAIEPRPSLRLRLSARAGGPVLRRRGGGDALPPAALRVARR